MTSEQIPAGSPDAMAHHLFTEFAARHGRQPIGCFAAPGRVNLIGEHLDYNDGKCLPIALPHATYAALAPRDDDRVSVTSLQQDRAWEGRVAGLGPGEVEGWATYVAGVAWALQEDGISLPGVDILVDSTVPVGAGLSSSAALECSVAIGLCALMGIAVDDDVRHRLVTACMRAETEVAGAPTGGMDQTSSLFSTAGHALLLDCRDWSTRQVTWDLASAGLSLLVVDTRAKHTLTDGGYGSRRNDCEAAAKALGVSSLRDVSDPGAALGALTDAQVRRRARHVFTEMARVDEAVRQLEDADLVGLGTTFTASHESLRDDYEVSCPELDVVVSIVLDQGALGARMTGGGFGGSAIALVPTDVLPAAEGAVEAAFLDNGWPAPGFLVAVPGPGAHQVTTA